MVAATTLKSKFDRDYTPEPNSGCWLWMGAEQTKPKNWEGPRYGVIQHRMGGRCHRLLAHRVAYELYVGPIPEGMLVLHKRICNNRACVNPQHLYLGNHRQNAADSTALGTRGHLTQPRRFIEDKRVLTDAEVAEAQGLYRPGVRGHGSRMLARRFGVGANTMLRALQRKP